MHLTYLAHDSPMEHSTGVPKSCRRHRRNSDVFADCQNKQSSDDSESDCDESSVGTLGLVSDSEDVWARTELAATRATHSGHACEHAAIGYGESPKHGHRLGQRRTPGLSRNRTVYACQTSDKDAAGIQETIRGNTHDEPMSSMKALRIFDTVRAAGPRHMAHGRLREHDPLCKHCVSEATESAHNVAREVHGHGELRMNLGDGRNAVYVAPCEQNLECPLEKKGKYLIHTNKPKIMTDMSKVEFGICVDGWKRLVFKTVTEPELAQRELAIYRKVANSQSDHLMHLLDDFTDNSSRHVMVFPRKVNACIYGHDLFDIAYIGSQLFTALKDLHAIGIAHLDITPTNLMSDATDPSHIQIIDFGLACDISETADGRLPSRGTCGFVAPEVLAGSASDLRADIYSAGVVLGMMLQRYLPTINLRLLGGPLVRSDTTDAIVAQLDELLEAYQYRPGQVEFVECDTKYVAVRSCPPPPTMPKITAPSSSCPVAATPSLAIGSVRNPILARKTPVRTEVFYSNKRSHSDDDENEALAAAYVGGGSLLGSYGDFDDDDSDSAVASHNRFSGYNAIYCRTQSGSAATYGIGRSDHSSQYSSNRTVVGDSDDYFARSERYYSSPQNTPISFMHDEHRGPERFSLASHLTRVPESHSSARYAAGSAQRRGSASRMPIIRVSLAQEADAKDSVVGRPGRVPLAVLHAADLLRWTLQPEAKWRPTAAQALLHPFLASIEVRRWRSRSGHATADIPANGSMGRQSPVLAASHLLTEGVYLTGANSELAEHTNLHTCVHNSSHGVSSECNSRQTTPIVSEPKPLCEPAHRDQGMFRGSAASDIRAWESELHQRMSHVHGDRVDSDSSHSYDHAKDAISSFY
ncbi:hypothetical protein IW148_000927 [Coemansia sp. RSA 1199]|nr:hypothetical protein IW148_000927 [Coemansia sp. RSA 1199]